MCKSSSPLLHLIDLCRVISFFHKTFTLRDTFVISLFHFFLFDAFLYSFISIVIDCNEINSTIEELNWKWIEFDSIKSHSITKWLALLMSSSFLELQRVYCTITLAITRHMKGAGSSLKSGQPFLTVLRNVQDHWQIIFCNGVPVHIPKADKILKLYSFQNKKL